MSTITLNTRVKQRIDTAANWSVNNVTLSLGEIGIESDTLKFKVGDGATTWNSLGYCTVTPTQLTAKEDALAQNSTAKTVLAANDTIVISDSAASNATKKITWTNFKAKFKTLFGANGTKVIDANDTSGNTKFLELYCNGSYIYLIGNSINGTAGNMVFQANNNGSVTFNTAGGGPINLQTNNNGAINMSTPDVVLNSNNHLQTDATSSVINKLPIRAGRLMIDERITISTSAPSGGVEGDIWITY